MAKIITTIIVVAIKIPAPETETHSFSKKVALKSRQFFYFNIFINIFTFFV